MDTVQTLYTDADILEGIHKKVRGFDPLKQARDYFSYDVHDGHVTVRGYVRTPQARRVFMDSVPDIPGVVDIDGSAFYDDDSLRGQVGRVLPRGVLARVNYGVVVLTGALTPEVNVDELKASVHGVTGVREVMTDFILR